MKRFAISKEFTFAAAHHLPHLPAHHKCRRPHGHNYTVQLVLASDELDGYGFVVDYDEMSRFGESVRNRYDHQDLNAVLDVPPTAEALATVLWELAWELWPHMVEAVRVAETPTTWAEYRG